MINELKQQHNEKYLYLKSIIDDTLSCNDLKAPVRPRVLLDMYVLAQGVKTGIYKVCYELFKRLSALEFLDVGYYLRSGFEESTLAFVKENFPCSYIVTDDFDNNEHHIDILFSAHRPPNEIFRNTKSLLHAHIIYDAIPLVSPHLATQEAANEVKDIIHSLGDNTLIFAISEHTKRDLLAIRPDLYAQNIVVMHLASSDCFSPCRDEEKIQFTKKKYGIPEHAPYALSVSTLEVRKNLQQAVKSFLQFLTSNPSSQMLLVLAGMPGWMREDLDNAISASGKFRDRIILTGFVDEVDLSALYSGALCFIYPTLYEGFGLPALEAMSCGTPVIASNNSSLPEVIGQTGILLDAKDTLGFASAISLLESNPERRAELSRASIERAAKFSWDKAADVVVEGLSILLNKNARQTLGAKSLYPVNRTTSTVSQYNFPFRNKRPLISYITVVKNAEETIEKTLLSVLNQSYKNVEHIVFDGQSTDSTCNIISNYRNRIAFFESSSDTGLYNAINKALPKCKGDLICVLNADDWLQIDAAERISQLYNASVDAQCILSAALVHVNKHSDPHLWTPDTLHPGRYFTCANVCHNGIYATRGAYNLTSVYDSSLRIAADFKWIMAAVDAGVTFSYTEFPTINFALGGISSDSVSHWHECVKIVQQKFPFLGIIEIQGLLHCFFVWKKEEFSKLPGYPPDRKRFLSEILYKHAGQVDFVNALVFAELA